MHPFGCKYNKCTQLDAYCLVFFLEMFGREKQLVPGSVVFPLASVIYAYRTGISWWIFAADILVVMIITLLTPGAYTFRAANADPVKSIRNE
jgi:hypothetical protein